MPRGRKKLSKEYLLDKLKEAFVLLGNSPSQREIDKLPGFPSRNAYRTHFGSLDKAKVLIGMPLSLRGTAIPKVLKATIKEGRHKVQKHIKPKEKPVFACIGCGDPNHHAKNRCYRCYRKYWKTGIHSYNPEKICNASLRFHILHRDSFTCQYCGRVPSDGIKLQVDHIIPQSKNGKTKWNNLITSCSECNRGKSNLTLSILPKTKASIDVFFKTI